jgi:hypothetical protein
MSLPFLEAMMPAGLRRAAAAPPVRFLLYFWPHGSVPSKWESAAEGALTAGDLSPATQVFRPSAGKIDLAPYLTFVAGVGDPFNHYKAGHQCSMVGTGEGDGDGRSDQGSWPTLASIDQVLAAQLGKETPLPSLAVSAASAPSYPTPKVVLSWKGQNQPISPYNRPMQVFALLFSGGTAGTPTAGGATAPDKLLLRESSLLDAVKDSSARLRARLGPGDRRRLDEYDASVREIERGLQAVAKAPDSASCKTIDGAPFARTVAPSGEAGDLEDLLLKLVLLAFRCDRTRYASYMLEFALGDKRWSKVGSSFQDHALSHTQNQDAIVARTNIKLGYMAGLMRDMAAIDEGGSSLLDNTIIYSNSDCYYGDSHDRKNSQCIIVGGRAGGRLKGGRRLKYSGKPINDLLASLCNYAGLPMDKWGKQGTGTLPSL